ncbi:MAG TPA: PilW family protein [Thermoanaerobaculia bacterium]|nr:PilW family protein [Thermoanaerobaculia bacterium]
MPRAQTTVQAIAPHRRGRHGRCRGDGRGERGFSLLEVVVATMITAEVILAALALFDFHNKLARVQGQVTDMQQSLRVAQYDMVRFAREAGRGGFPAYLQAGTANEAYGAIAVRNNVGGLVSNQIAIGFGGSPTAVNGTDILTLRGAFSTPIFQLNPAVPSLTLLPVNTTPAGAVSGTVVVCATTPTGIAQDLSPLITAVTAAAGAGQVEPLILVSPLSESIYAVVELNTANSNLTSNQPQCPSPAGVANPNGVLIAFHVTGDANANAFQQLGAVNSVLGLPAKMTSVAWLGILEEYRYYIRQDYLVPGNAATDLAPHLSRARMYPGTETPYYNNATNLQVDVADNILDLQVALGVDNDGDGRITEGSQVGNPPSQTPTTTDDWIYNIAGDAPFPTLPAKPQRLLELRISTLAKTGNPDFKYQGPKITNIEDHTYTASDFANTFHGRCYRHRLLTTVVGLRNL